MQGGEHAANNVFYRIFTATEPPMSLFPIALAALCGRVLASYHSCVGPNMAGKAELVRIRLF
jgi:hypothetical protein